MKLSRLVGLFAVLVILSSSSINMWTASALYDHIQNNEYELKDDITHSIKAPGVVNMSQLYQYEYHEDIKGDRRFKWKVETLERTDNFHLAEGDKNIKQGDNIILLIGTDPSLQLDQPHLWALIYINDVMARFSNDATHGRAIFKFVQPIGIDYWDNFTDDYYNSPAFLDYYEANYNYTDFAVTHYGQTFFYNETSFADYLDRSPYINPAIWSVLDDTVVYTNTIITETNNVTQIEITYDKETGLANTMIYSASFINGTGHFAGVNMTLIRLHGWGLPYTITTWVVWIPILLVTVGLIVAIRLRAFQRFKLYLEARKIAQRK